MTPQESGWREEDTDGTTRVKASSTHKMASEEKGQMAECGGQHLLRGEAENTHTILAEW